MASMFDQYIRNGWVLAPLRPGDKNPRGKGWNRRELCLDQPEEAAGLKSAGLCHAYSGTCCLDIDDVETARPWLSERGINLDELADDPDSVKIVSGRPNRLKLLYSLDRPIPSYKVVQNKANFLDFRCATRAGRTVQDALPPSIHPDTGKPYKWDYDDLATDWSMPPPMPVELLAVWRSLVEERDERAPKELERDYSDEELQELLLPFDPDDDYNSWINVGMALHHATGGADRGLDIWDDWSSTGEKYKGRGDLDSHWRSFQDGGISVDYLLMHRVASADDFEPVTEESAADGEENRTARFVAEPIGEWVKRPPPDWIVRSVMPQSDLAMIFGDPGSGKSFFALDMAMAISGSADWWGKDTEHGPVLWIAAEAAGSVRNRALAYANHHGIRLTDNDLWIIGDTPDLNKLDDVRAIGKAAHEIEPRMIIVDTMVAAAGGANENSGEDMAVVFAACRALHRITKALVVLVHHTGKDKAKGARGWSGIKGAMQTMIELEHNPDNGERVARMHKQRDGEEGVEYPFRLTPVPLPAHDGVPQESCIVEPVEGVTMFRPVLHAGWLGMGLQPFMDAETTQLDYSQFDSMAQHDATESGVANDMAESFADETCKLLADAGVALMSDGGLILQFDTMEDLT